eukprot:CAMPEP_0197528950 /NCGR_PEP_ID=MMETSP1318-20131121/26867_1 /TAXON_ID=552666 /ORGANISM="Partenskyella glossopodia, Strain RCC365" /LENGTH=210 /DNA_ID=CAMNT_0043084249 /DNA_START=73 /DNA_END=705 /DNA_ORIENTATION=+
MTAPSHKRRLLARLKGCAKQIDFESLPASDLPKNAPRPKLIVFDLDNTCWTPELYQLQTYPKPGKDIKLFKGSMAALHELATKEEWKGTKVACASRTEDTAWAHKLITKFEIAPGKTMSDLFSFVEIYPGNKRKHFGKLKKESGVNYDEMMFFDDDTWNTDEIEKLGVLCVYCPRGLSPEIWNHGVQEYANLKKSKSDMGRTVGMPKRFY